MQEIRVQSLGLEDPLEKETATCSSIPAWKIEWTEKPGYSPLESKESAITEHACIGKTKLQGCTLP